MADLFGPVEPAPHVAAGQSQLRAAAGSAVTVQLTITNLATEPRVMSLTTHGLDPAWLPTPSRSRALAPGESIVADVVLHPSVGTIAARYPLAIAVQALDPVTGLATGPTALAELDTHALTLGMLRVASAEDDYDVVVGTDFDKALAASRAFFG